MISQADVIKEVSKRTGYRKVDIKAVLECFEEVVLDYVKELEEVKIFNGLTLRGEHKNARTVWNPAKLDYQERRAGTIVKARITNALRKKFF